MCALLSSMCIRINSLFLKSCLREAVLYRPRHQPLSSAPSSGRSSIGLSIYIIGPNTCWMHVHRSFTGHRCTALRSSDFEGTAKNRARTRGGRQWRLVSGKLSGSFPETFLSRFLGLSWNSPEVIRKSSESFPKVFPKVFPEVPETWRPC